VAPLDDSEEGFELMGTYHVTDAGKLLEAFEAIGIEYQVEFNDGVADINPAAAAEGGRYGSAAQVSVHVRTEQRELADKIYFGLFKDYLPNYDSPFFDNPDNVQENTDEEA
jgi:hypothetical protein